MKECGFNIKTVSNELFEKLLEEKVTTSRNSENLIGLFADLTASSNEKVVETEADNTFTNEALYQLGYTWAPTNNEYLTNIFKKMMEKSYFD